MGLSEDETSNVRRAGAIHDIGMVGVPSGVWDATEPWTLAQSERARTHPYLSERMFARVPAMKSVVACAAQHHERLDGSGYPHGLTASAIGPTARVLAAADVYQALRQARPHRPAFDGDTAVATMRQEVQDGTARSRRRQRRAARRRPPGRPPRRAAVWPHTARGRRSRPAGSWPVEPRDRIGAHDQPQDGVVAPRAHLHEDRCHHPHRGSAVRDAHRPGRRTRRLTICVAPT